MREVGHPSTTVDLDTNAPTESEKRPDQLERAGQIDLAVNLLEAAIGEANELYGDYVTYGSTRHNESRIRAASKHLSSYHLLLERVEMDNQSHRQHALTTTAKMDAIRALFHPQVDHDDPIQNMHRLDRTHFLTAAFNEKDATPNQHLQETVKAQQALCDLEAGDLAFAIRRLATREQQAAIQQEIHEFTDVLTAATIYGEHPQFARAKIAEKYEEIFVNPPPESDPNEAYVVSAERFFYNEHSPKQSLTAITELFRQICNLKPKETEVRSFDSHVVTLAETIDLNILRAALWTMFNPDANHLENAPESAT